MKKTIKIIVPILIAVVIAGMLIAKGLENNQQKQIVENSISDAEFELNSNGAVNYDKLFEYKLPVIVDYGSDSCIPCKQMAPVLETLNKDMKGKAFVKFVDVWKYTDAANDIPIQLIPTQVLFNADGTPFKPSEELSSKIEFTMYQDDKGNHIFTTHQGGITEDELRLILEEMGVQND